MKGWKKWCLIITGIEIITIMAVVYLKFVYNQKSKYTIVTSTTLKEAINVSDLSTAKFIYNGIAEVYNADNTVSGHIKYNAEVKAGIDMNDVEFEINEQNLSIKLILPEIKIQANIVDEQKLSFIPESIDIDISEALKVCQEDAEREAKESDELIKTAQENLENTIEALIYPIVKEQGYSIIF